LNDPDTAAIWLRKAAAASPGDLGLLVTLADVQIRTGDRNAAQATIARGLEKDPKNRALLALASRIKN